VTSWIWVAPAAVALVAIVVLAWVAARVAEEARDLHGSVRRMGQVRPALLEVRTAGHLLQRTAATLRQR
jgi:hypothetical protein